MLGVRFSVLGRVVASIKKGSGVTSACLPSCHRAFGTDSTESVPSKNAHLIKEAYHKLEVSPTLQMNIKARLRAEAGEEVFPLGFGQSPFPVPNVMVEALKANAYRKDYLPVKGLSTLRDKISAFHTATTGMEQNPNNIIVGPGSKELLYLTIASWRGEVLLPNPSWVSYRPQCEMTDTPYRLVDTTAEEHFMLSPEAIARSVPKDGMPRLLVLNYPNNPVGRSFSREELEALAKACEQYNIYILSDEIYGRLTYASSTNNDTDADAHCHHSISSYHNNTIVTSGLSKWAGAGGWRLGYACFPSHLSDLGDTVASAASETFSCAATPVQYAAQVAFEDNDSISEYLTHSRRILRTVAEHCYVRLGQAGIEVQQPQGGFYLFPRFNGLKPGVAHGSADLCSKLAADTGVFLLRGSAFYRPEEELSARLSFVNFDGKKALEASIAGEDASQNDFVKNRCPNTWEAIERICQWTERHSN
eukprot:TRINITY_DN902_c0_g2_i1.p1 TRINITY_DN902_c0_g2~~TRINITY_DN902_c0_g2_i1.p1  ORF type:complete len:486 (+),score=53.84 TRINITY_DN902_c0_g2_i1:33-1460(+)